VSYADERDAHNRSDRSLRALGDLLLEQLRSADASDLMTPEPADVILVVAARGSDLNGARQYLLPAATIDEVARVLGALPQIRGGRR
jgi:hypothetical protein